MNTVAEFGQSAGENNSHQSHVQEYELSLNSLSKRLK
jgi:hypothetical protein